MREYIILVVKLLISCRKIYNELAKKSSQSFDSFKEKMESIAIMIK